ncbi:MAG: HEPN domain-containing protein, partial [Planctomycetes bacterium]|nr:HEPN domain-containing protein [Planctomycetota bacterium]
MERQQPVSHWLEHTPRGDRTVKEFEATPDVLYAMLARRDLKARSFGDAASRSYYAVFHALSAMIATRGLTYSSHSQTIGAFNREFVKTGVFVPETSRKQQRLFEDRQIADYDWKRHVDEETACEDVTDAACTIDKCRRYVN